MRAARRRRHPFRPAGRLRLLADVLVINVGDTVTWQWTSFSHTVTNGTGSGDPNVGRRFDGALSSLSPTFSYTFTTAGTVPYFCRPHELMGMSGTVIVQNTSGVDQAPARRPAGTRQCAQPLQSAHPDQLHASCGCERAPVGA